MALLLGRADLEALARQRDAMSGAMDAVEAVHREARSGQAFEGPWFQLPREAGGSLLVVPGASPGGGVALRVRSLGGPAGATPCVLLFDGRTGALLALMSDALNVLRTAAPAGVACRHLAPPEAATLAVIGSGRQARGQIRAAAAALPSLRTARVYSPQTAHRQALVDELAPEGSLRIEAAASARAAVEGAQVVCLAANAQQPVLEAGWIAPGALVICIASPQLPPELLLGEARLIVPVRQSFMDRAAERRPYAQLVPAGRWEAARIAADLGEVLAGDRPARQRAGEVVLFDMPGLGLWDAAVGGWAYRTAAAQGRGAPLDLA